MSDPLDATLVETAWRLRTSEFSAVEITRLCLDRIAAQDAAIGAFTHVEADCALDVARAADVALARGDAVGPLHGVPIARKDNIGRAGQRLTVGSRAFATRRAEDTAQVLAALDQAGAIDLGATSLAEFAFHVNGVGSLAPPPRNPWNRAHIAGGSSGGSAAAVAARFVFGALGTDSGGSIRSPASLCGITGLMPTRGVVERAGMALGSATVDVIGPMARNARDCARLLSVLAPSIDAEASLDAPVRGLRVGLLRDAWPLPAETRAAIDAAARVFEGAGVLVQHVTWPGLERVNDLASTVFVHEVARTLAPTLAAHADDIHPEIQARLRLGLAIDPARYAEAMRALPEEAAGFVTGPLAGLDALLLPGAPTTAPRFDDVVSGASASVHGAGSRVDPGRYTRAFNYLGVPAIVLPVGFDTQGLPIGMQIVAAPHAEVRLLQLAHAYQHATTWHRRVPD